MKIQRFLALSAFAIGFGSIVAGTAAYASGQRSVAVLSDQPQSLTLMAGNKALDSFNPVWKQTDRGYETVIRFPIDYITSNSRLVLIRADGKGKSTWGAPHMRFLRSNNVGSHDPACVGGKRWCAQHGL